MKKLLPLLLIVLLLCACSGEEAAPTTAAPTTQATEATTLPTEAPTTVPTEPPVVYRHPLNGQVLEAPHTTRPTAIVVNNIRWALPQHGTAQADVLIEIMAEGGITRNLAIFSSFEDVGNIGSIRSARTYFISLAKAFDAPLMHNGDSNLARNLFNTGAYEHVDCEYPYFFRDQDRLNSGMALEHTMFTSGKLMQDCVDKHFNMTADPEATYGFIFDEGVEATGEAAATVKATYSIGGKTSEFRYDEAEGSYSFYQHDRDYKDGNTGEKVYFENVIFMYAQMRITGDSSGHVLHTLEGENTGFYARDGKISPITWRRTAEPNPFSFYYADGSDVIMSPGKTYIVILPTGSKVDYQ